MFGTVLERFEVISKKKIDFLFFAPIKNIKNPSPNASFLTSWASQIWFQKNGGFGDFWQPSRGPTNPISGGFVVPMGTTKPPEMGFVGPREGCQKSPKPPFFWNQIWLAQEVRNEAFGLGFFMFFIGAKNKKSIFFLEMTSNRSKTVPNIPKRNINIILLCFTVIMG